MQSKNLKLLKEFTAYCKKYPELRFWQALRNWSGWPFILVSNSTPEAGQGDTFFFEHKDH